MPHPSRKLVGLDPATKVHVAPRSSLRIKGPTGFTWPDNSKFCSALHTTHLETAAPAVPVAATHVMP